MKKFLVCCLALTLIFSLSACGKSERFVMKKKIVRRLSTAIVYVALFIIGILAIPVCVFLVPIIIIWTFTDKIVKRLGRE